MKLLFAVRHPLYLRDCKLAVRELARRGHRIHIAFPNNEEIDTAFADRLSAEHAEITVGYLPERTGWWRPVTNTARGLVDWLRYVESPHEPTSTPAAQAARHVPPSFTRLFGGRRFFRGAFVRRLAVRWLPVLDRQIPPDGALLDYVREQRPNLVLVTPLVDFNQDQHDVLKAATELGIPTALCVASWDNLINKGAIQIEPDRIFVRNETQRREAIDVHEMPEAIITLAGTQLFDERAATPNLVGEIEALARGPRRKRARFWAPAVRAVCYPVAKYSVRPRYLAWEADRRRRGEDKIRGLSPRGAAADNLFRERATGRDQYTRAFVHTKLNAVIEDADKKLRGIAAGHDPLLVGPWLSEVGYELLYWIPFVSWAVEHYGISRDRLVIVSRGGAALWYGDLAHRRLEIFDHFNPDSFRLRNEARLLQVGIQKQKKAGSFDEEIISIAKKQLGCKTIDVLHPALMYNGFLRYHWSGRSSMQHLLNHTRHQMLTPPSLGGFEENLPKDYFAVRFYFRDSFRDTADNRALADRVVENLSREADIVLLNTPYHVDEHRDAATATGRRIMLASEFMTPQNNLDVQTRIIARSRAFIGTYGGLSYIAPLYGRPAVSFHDGAETVLAAHVNTAACLFREFKVPYLLLTAGELDILRTLTGRRAVGEEGRVA